MRQAPTCDRLAHELQTYLAALLAHPDASTSAQLAAFTNAEVRWLWWCCRG